MSETVSSPIASWVRLASQTAFAVVAAAMAGRTQSVPRKSTLLKSSMTLLRPMFFVTLDVSVSQSTSPTAVITSAASLASSFARDSRSTPSTCNQHVCGCNGACHRAHIQTEEPVQTSDGETSMIARKAGPPTHAPKDRVRACSLHTRPTVPVRTTEPDDITRSLAWPRNLRIHERT